MDEWLQPYRRLWAKRLDASRNTCRRWRTTSDDARPRQGTSSYGRLEQGTEAAGCCGSRGSYPIRRKVWRALTEPEHLKKWFPSDIEGERAAGAKLRFVFREGEGPTMDGEMLAFDPPSLMEMRWGDEILRFELRPEGDGSVLEFTNIFDELGKAARDAAGWHACLDLLALRRGRSRTTVAVERAVEARPGSTTGNGSVPRRRRSDRRRSGRRSTATAESPRARLRPSVRATSGPTRSTLRRGT